MSGIGTILCVGVFGLFIIGNFACQIYVATKVFEGSQVIWGIVRGTRTFIHGWKRADELGIKDIMIFWSILLATLLLIICVVTAIVLVNGPPT